MAYVFRHPGVAVTVDGLALAGNRFSIHGVVAYAREGSPAARRRAEAAALLATIAGLLREADRGLRRGARDAEIAVTGDPRLAGGLRRLASRPVSARAARAIPVELTPGD